MLFAIDSGNTNVVFAVFSDDGEIAHSWRIETVSSTTVASFKHDIIAQLNKANIVADDISDAIIATVVPDNLKDLIELCRVCFAIIPLVVGEDGVDLGLDVLVDHPSEVGADRLVNAVAAGQLYQKPLVCVDFGTATTFDVIDKYGNYAGGAIAPGINLSLQALYSHAAKLPRIDVTPPPKVIGTNTIAAMQSGIYWGYVAMIEGMVERIHREYGKPLCVIATGGLSPLFSKAIPMIQNTNVDLTMRGLYIIYKRNRSS